MTAARHRAHALRRHDRADGDPGANRNRDVRPGRHRLHRARERGRLAESPEGGRVRPFLRVRAVGDPALPVDRPVRDPRRALAVALPARGRARRTSSRRACDGGGSRSRRLRRDLRLVGRHGRHGDACRVPRDAPARLLGAARHRDAGRRRHDGHPASALGHPHHLRDPDRAEHRQAVRRRALARGDRHRRLPRHDLGVRETASAGGAGAAAQVDARRHGDAEGRVAGGGDFRARVRRHLRRRFHADRGRCHRCGADVHRRLRQARADGGGHPRVVPGRRLLPAA